MSPASDDRVANNVYASLQGVVRRGSTPWLRARPRLAQWARSVSGLFLAAPVALPAIEVYNGTLTFASATGGSAGSGTFEVPKDYGNLTVTVTGFGDCPGYSKQGAIHITANGLDESLPVPFTALFGGAPGSDAAGYEPSTDRVSEATAAVTWSVGPGTGSLQATGEFTGEARVVVVAGP